MGNRYFLIPVISSKIVKIFFSEPIGNDNINIPRQCIHLCFFIDTYTQKQNRVCVKILEI